MPSRSMLVASCEALFREGRYPEQLQIPGCVLVSVDGMTCRAIAC